MKAYLIDPYAETVTEVEHNNDYKQIYSFIDAQCFDVARVEKNADAIFVDDEGLLHLTPETKFFLYDGYHSPLAGKGLMLGLNVRTGNSVSVKTKLELVKSKVHFFTLAQARRWSAENNS